MVEGEWGGVAEFEGGNLPALERSPEIYHKIKPRYKIIFPEKDEFYKLFNILK